jgi:LuxR family transcriptional regulator
VGSFDELSVDTHKYKLLEMLTPREREIMLYYLRGKTAKETAILTNLTYRTIEYYFTNIKRKLNCRYKHDLLSMFDN